MVVKVMRREFIQRCLLAGIGAAAFAPGNPLLAVSQTRSSKEPFNGIFPIIQTPFREDYEIDENVLEKEVDYVIECGGHGIVWPQLASEFYMLTDEERFKTMEVIVKAAHGRIPVIIGVQSTNYWKTSLKFAQHAESIGADGIISLPPYTSNATVEATAEYFRTLARTVSLPIFVQNSGGTYGPAMPIDMIISIAREYPAVSYIKEEAEPVFERMVELTKNGKGILKGVLSGANGINLMNELKGGSSGSCPGAGFVDVFASIYENFRKGKEEKAGEMFELLLPMQKFDKIGWLAREKEILRRRGIFKNTRMRVAPYELVWDKTIEREFEVLFEKIKPYFKV
ncbi:dihydrodipicolinate synthase family protein [Candidatus Latescibacterota bacterium]